MAVERRRVRADELAQRPGLHELHRDKGVALVEIRVEDEDDVGRLSFVHELRKLVRGTASKILAAHPDLGQKGSS